MPGHFPLSKNSPYWGRFSSLTVNARSLEMTRCNWPCRPMKWLVPGMLWIRNKIKGTWNIDHNSYPFFSRLTNTSDVLTQTWPGLKRTWRKSRLRARTMIPLPVRGRKVCVVHFYSKAICVVCFLAHKRLCEMLKWVACKCRRLQTEGKEDG